jgi:hypothetical protein
VILWYVGLSVVLVQFVFRSSGIDYRLVALGALLPLAVDVPFGRPAYGHTLAFGVATLLVVMVGTIGQPRLVRRRLVCIPLGVLCGLVLSGAWTDADVFWWPAPGSSFPDQSLLPPLAIVALEELVGLAACVWVVMRCGLVDEARRRQFLRTGRLQELTDTR